MNEKNIYIGIPSYTMMIDLECCASLISNIRTLEHNGYKVQLAFKAGNCYVDDTRNAIVRDFVASNCSVLIFVDSDLAFDPDAILKLVKSEKHLVGGAYPKKYGDGFPVEIIRRDDGQPWEDVRDGMIKCRHMPTGLMKITRNVLKELREAHPEWVCDDGNITYFKTGVLFDDKKYYGEDVAFCRYCEALNISMWIEPTICFKHIGKQPKVGQFREYLNKAA